MAVTMCGSPMYMAPEVLMCHKYNASADIWSMGIIVYQCLTGKAPFYANTPEALKGIYEKTAILKPKIPITTSKTLRDLLMKMLVRKPHDRINFQSFLAHPFLKHRPVDTAAFLPNKPASVPPLPGGVRRGINTSDSRAFHLPPPSASASRPAIQSNRTVGTPAVMPLRSAGLATNRMGEPSKIAAFMPSNNQAPRVTASRGASATTHMTRLLHPQPASYIPAQYQHRSNLPTAAVRVAYDASAPVASAVPRATYDSYSGTDLSETSGLADNEPLDEYLEDGLGGSSFLHRHDGDVSYEDDREATPTDSDRPGHIMEGLTDLESDVGGSQTCALSMSGYGGLGTCLATDYKPRVEQPPFPLDNRELPTGYPHDVYHCSPLRQAQAGFIRGASGSPYRTEQGLEKEPLDDYVIVNSDGSEFQSELQGMDHGVGLRGRDPPAFYRLDWTRRSSGGEGPYAYSPPTPPVEMGSYRHLARPGSLANTDAPTQSVGLSCGLPTHRTGLNRLPLHTGDGRHSVDVSGFSPGKSANTPTQGQRRGNQMRCPAYGVDTPASGVWLQPAISESYLSNSDSQRHLFGQSPAHEDRRARHSPAENSPPIATRAAVTGGHLGYGKRCLTAPGEFSSEAYQERPRNRSANENVPCSQMPGELHPGLMGELPELAEEAHMDAAHTKEIKTITMVLELCELLTELAERRASALTSCTAAAESKPNEQSPPSDEEVTSHKKTPSMPALHFTPEAKRIVEQIVLYRRVLYYLEYVFAQVTKAVDQQRLHATTIARKRLTDCNALYHRCYIRLRQLARQSLRDDLVEPVGCLLSNITANRLIFHYALDQCYAAEMDEYIGEINLCLQRYKAAITLIHGLCQHAKSPVDKNLLSECMRLIRDRHANLWALAMNEVSASPCENMYQPEVVTPTSETVMDPRMPIQGGISSSSPYR